MYLQGVKTRRIYMFTLCKPGESEGSEPVVLLTVLSDIPVGVV